MTALKGGRSLRRRLLLGMAALGLLLATSFGVLLRVSSTLRTELAAAADQFIEEQRIADRLLRAVSRQLVAASLFAVRQDDEVMGEFRSASDEAYRQVRLYLFRALTPRQRLKLEGVKEQHERLEVAATQAFSLFAAGDHREGQRQAEAMVGHSMILQRELDGFLEMRESDLAALRTRQADVVGYVHGGVGGLLLLLIAGSAAVALFLHRRINTPLVALADAAARIGSGDLTARVASLHDDEFNAVAGSFNHMIEQLAGAHFRLEQRNHQLQEAVEKLRAMQDELIQTEKLSAMGRMMAGLAHELNNPLASVLGYGQLLDQQLEAGDEFSAAEVREEFIGPLLNEAVRARSLVQDFLLLSRNAAPELDRVRLRDPLEMIVRLRAYAFEQAGLRITVKEGAEHYVMAQPQRLQQVILNIVNNALDAMAPRAGGTLSVSVHRDDDSVVMTFDDDGPGFERPDRVLEPFYTTKAPGSGTGMGLALVHQYMDEIGGAVRAENRPEGGARILLRFRAAARRIGDRGRVRCLPEAADAACPAPPDLRTVRILVVEDEAPLRTLQKRFLERLNAEVLLASGVDEAKRILACTTLDLVISDVKMPGGSSGIDLFRWVELSHPELAERFLFVTGDISDGEIGIIAQQHPGRVLRKPFMLREYTERVTAMLSMERAAAA